MRSSLIFLLHTGHTIGEALEVCGMNEDNDIYKSFTAAERFSSDVFSDSWNTFIDVTFEELEDHYKTYATLRKDMGRILVQVSTRVNIKALIQWARNLIRTGKKTEENIFTLEGKATLLTQVIYPLGRVIRPMDI